MKTGLLSRKAGQRRRFGRCIGRETRRLRQFVFASAFLAGLFSAGCASMVPEPKVEVTATRNAKAPPREQKTYAITCPSTLIQQWFVSDRPALLALDAALEKLGYEEAPNPALATTMIVAHLGFGPRQVLEQIENPDSVRFQNVAAMAGQGRYSQILTERNESSGSLLVGPNGQIIPTGGWKKLMEDSEQRETQIVGTHDSLILRAWDVIEQDKEARILAWEVVVLRTIDHKMPSPQHVGILIRHAAERLNAGWPDTAAPAKSVPTTAEGQTEAPAVPPTETAAKP